MNFWDLDEFTGWTDKDIERRLVLISSDRDFQPDVKALEIDHFFGTQMKCGPTDRTVSHSRLSSDRSQFVEVFDMLHDCPYYYNEIVLPMC